MARLTLKVNGKNQAVDAEPDMPLLYALRNDLQLNGPKFGCGLSQCGACTVHLDGEATEDGERVWRFRMSRPVDAAPIRA